jgi:hypothetical protein
MKILGLNRVELLMPDATLFVIPAHAGTHSSARAMARNGFPRARE